MLHKLNIAPHTDSIHWLLAGVCVCVCVRCAADVLLVWSTTHSQSAEKKAHHSADAAIVCTHWHISTYAAVWPTGRWARIWSSGKYQQRLAMASLWLEVALFSAVIFYGRIRRTMILFIFSRLCYIVSVWARFATNSIAMHLLSANSFVRFVF